MRVPCARVRWSCSSFRRCLSSLASHAGFVLGRREALALTPSSDVEAVAERQRETAEARLFLESGGVMEFGDAGDVSMEAQRAAKGGVLTGLELRRRGGDAASGSAGPGEPSSARTRHARRWRRWRGTYRTWTPERPPSSAPLASTGRWRTPRLPRCVSFARRGRVAYGRLEDTLQRLVRSDRTRRVLQEPLVTERNGRLVVPVRVEMRSRMPGLVHDVSGSGETIFVEPLAAVSLGNQWRELKLAESREEERVLRELSLSIGDYADEVDLTQGLLARLDAAIAKGRYAIALSATPAATAPEGLQDVRLVSARHPLLKGNVVPLSLELGHVAVEYGEDAPRRIVLVTGPNGGGKTVALKTLGLMGADAPGGVADARRGRHRAPHIRRRVRRHWRPTEHRAVAVHLHIAHDQR